MKIGKHGFRDHLRLLMPLFGFIAAIWALRMILAVADSPGWVIRVTSVTTATSAAVLIAVILIHIRNFGSYVNVVVAAFVLNLWAQILISVAILFTAVTRMHNIYAAPEYSIPGRSQDHLRHIYGHMTFSTGAGTLTGAAFGCLLLLILRLLLPAGPRVSDWERKDR